MTTLSTHTKRVIRHKGMAAAHLIAAEYDCDVSDVLDLLVTTSFTHASGDDRPLTPEAVARLLKAIDELEPTPSQPELTSLDPAADTPAVPPASETDGPGEFSSLPTGPSVITIPPSHQAETLGEAVAATGGDAATDKAGGGDDLPPAPTLSPIEAAKRDFDKIRRWHRKEPTWPARMIATAIGISHQRVTMMAFKRGLKLPTQPEYDEEVARQRTHGLEASLREATNARRTRLGF